MQKKVLDFTQNNNFNCDITTRYMDLVSEVGELGKELIKATDYGTKDFAITSNTKSEVGDCLFSLLCLCNDLGISSEEALDFVLDKYKSRLK